MITDTNRPEYAEKQTHTRERTICFGGISGTTGEGMGNAENKTNQESLKSGTRPLEPHFPIPLCSNIRGPTSQRVGTRQG